MMMPSSDLPSPRRRLPTRRLPREDRTCGWLAPVAPRTPARRLSGSESADVVVVGAGFVGLAAARRLADLRPGWRIVLVDAQRAGTSSSGRSSGYLVDIAHFTTTFEPAVAERHVRLSRHGMASLDRLRREHAIDCAWDDRGWLHVAAGDAGMVDLGTLRRWLDDHGEAYEWLGGEELAATLGTRFYRAGLRMPGRPLVQAGALVRGLAEALPEPVELYEETAVVSLERRGRGPDAGSWQLETTSAEGPGVLETPRLVVAVNAWAPSLGLVGRRIFPLMTFGSLTRPLTAAEQETLGGDREWGVLAQDPLGSSVRRTRDQRLLIRNGAHYSRRVGASSAVRRRAVADHRRSLAARFPTLADLPFDSSWAGALGASPSRLPFFGALADGLWTAAGFVGAGITLGTTAGELLAELASGETSPLLEDMLALPRPPVQPPEPFLSVGIKLRVARMNASAGDTL